MIKPFEIYQCASCGKMLEILRAGKGEMSCCGRPMKLVVENATEAAREKHAPIVERLPSGFIVKVGSIPHPMDVEHYIEWIELIAEDVAYRRFLTPGQMPRAAFTIEGARVTARHYCNLHGLWKSQPGTYDARG
jgi:superoxide reductase